MTFDEAVKAYANAIGISLKEATEDANKTIALYESKGMPHDFAVNSWIEEQEDLDVGELNEMENLPKPKMGARDEVKAKTKKPRTVKENPEKIQIISAIAEKLAEIDAEKLEIVNPQQKIDFWIGENYYSVSLTAHRTPKK